MSHCTQPEEPVKRTTQPVAPDWAEVLRKLQERRNRKPVHPVGSIVRYRPEGLIGMVLAHVTDEYGDHLFLPDDHDIRQFKAWGIHLEPAERQIERRLSLAQQELLEHLKKPQARIERTASGAHRLIVPGRRHQTVFPQTLGKLQDMNLLIESDGNYWLKRSER